MRSRLVETDEALKDEQTVESRKGMQFWAMAAGMVQARAAQAKVDVLLLGRRGARSSRRILETEACVGRGAGREATSMWSKSRS